MYPNYAVEPFPTFYLRTARAYRFLATWLQGTLGGEVLGELERLKEDGVTSSGQPLPSEPRAMTERWSGGLASPTH